MSLPWGVIPNIPSSIATAPAPTGGGGGFWSRLGRALGDPSKLTLGRAVRAVVPGGSNIVSAYDAMKHAAEVGREQARRIAEREGISELEAAALLARRLSESLVTQDRFDRNRGGILIAAVAVLGLALLLRRR